MYANNPLDQWQNLTGRGQTVHSQSQGLPRLDCFVAPTMPIVHALEDDEDEATETREVPTSTASLAVTGAFLSESLTDWGTPSFFDYDVMGRPFTPATKGGKTCGLRVTPARRRELWGLDPLPAEPLQDPLTRAEIAAEHEEATAAAQEGEPMVLAWNGDEPDTYRLIPQSEWRLDLHAHPDIREIHREREEREAEAREADAASPQEPEPEEQNNLDPEAYRAQLRNALDQAMGGDATHLTTFRARNEEQQSPSSGERPMSWFYGPSYMRGQETQEVFLRSTRLSGEREGLLIDPGAFDNLAGSRWVDRMRQLGYEGTYQEIRPIGVEGVGAQGQQATQSIQVRGHVRSLDGQTHSARYQAPVIQGSDIPALWGQKSLARNRAVLNTVDRTLHLCGAGEIQFTPPPGTLSLQLELSSSGHLLLPFTELQAVTSRQDRLNLNFSSVPLQIVAEENQQSTDNGGSAGN